MNEVNWVWNKKLKKQVSVSQPIARHILITHGNRGQKNTHTHTPFSIPKDNSKIIRSITENSSLNVIGLILKMKNENFHHFLFPLKRTRLQPSSQK